MTKPRGISGQPSGRMRHAATIWLDLYHNALSGLIDDETKTEHVEAKVEVAAKLADRGLSEFENRWPGVYPYAG